MAKLTLKPYIGRIWQPATGHWALGALGWLSTTAAVHLATGWAWVWLLSLGVLCFSLFGWRMLWHISVRGLFLLSQDQATRGQQPSSGKPQTRD